MKSSTSDESSTSTSHSSVVETHGGQVTTVTVGDSGSTSAADNANDSKSDGGGSGVSGGAIAGIVIGVVGGIALIAAAIILFLVKRRRDRQDAGYQNDSIDGRQSKGSWMSYAGGKGVFADNHSHTLSNGSSSAPQRMPTFTDNRLNTGAVLYPNGRRASDVSLQDNEDYSRPVLRVSRSWLLVYACTDFALAYQPRLIVDNYPNLLNHASNFPIFTRIFCTAKQRCYDTHLSQTVIDLREGDSCETSSPCGVSQLVYYQHNGSILNLISYNRSALDPLMVLSSVQSSLLVMRATLSRVESLCNLVG